MNVEMSQTRLGILVGKSYMAWKLEHATAMYEVGGAQRDFV